MKKILGLMVLVSILCVGCLEDNSSDNVLRKKQEAIMQEANAQVGMPAIKNFQERKLMKMILELRDQENLVCYAYMFAEQTGELTYVGRCIGFGLPYATQYTAPEKYEYFSSGSVTLPQADPNGLFMPSSAEGTWLMLIDEQTGRPSPCYFEPRIVVSPFKLKDN